MLFAAAKKKELKTIDDGRTKESSPTARKGVEASAPCVFLFPSPSGPSKAAYACGSRASGLKCAWNELKTAARRPKARAAWVPLARERRCCSGVRRRRRPLRRASKGIGCPRPQRRRRRNGGAPSPFLPLVALLTLRACRARRGGGVPQRGGSSERRRWSERGRSCIPLAAVFFPPPRRLWRQSSRAKTERRLKPTCSCSLSRSLYKQRANNRSVWTLLERRPSSTSSSSGKGEEGEKRKGRKSSNYLSLLDYVSINRASRVDFFFLVCKNAHTHAPLILFSVHTCSPNRCFKQRDRHDHPHDR